jgi:hypothetical protein
VPPAIEELGMRTTWAAAAVLICLGAGVAACGGGGADDPAGTSSPPAAGPLSDDFESVCRGVAVPAAAAYESATPGIHPLLVFSGADPEYTQDNTTLPDGWVVQYPDLEATQLVACVDRVSATLVDSCVGYDVDLEGDYSVETYDAVYEIVLYAATTAREIDRTTLEVPAAGCPSFVLFTEGEHVRAWYEPFGDELEAFLAPHVTG